jgi:hypothetical protein
VGQTALTRHSSFTIPGPQVRGTRGTQPPAVGQTALARHSSFTIPGPQMRGPPAVGQTALARHSSFTIPGPQMRGTRGTQSPFASTAANYHWHPFRRCSLDCGLRSDFHCDKTRTFKFAFTGKPEFHAEWLRDEPCDATTTCPRKTGVWCQLLPATAGNMRFGGRFSTLGRGGSLGTSSPITFAQLLSQVARS